ncbi:NAD binding domain of 6-phosphogluconate dehydrogenase-domain-containing protein [Fusarium redolens]|uniref:3-hydroxyisobutyrate dehydrogenase n=1 Tax=Fusarium redolens TaxID=48865 RepID=A0A9P9KV20_FUSRE|nr:NAD binding domain of 6-phosphogluconate dehydrogenase-domain-containing protein [Fusarium redolens]KAH7268977.1 NAD binding domain of 6-phosphogluconate dehydrogenase-domain-containing protein [Fusarium redolens]
MHAHNTLRQMSLGASFSRAQRGGASAWGLPHYRFPVGTGNSFATSAIASSTGRSNTIGFIGLGAMGSHMLNNLISRYRSPASGKDVGFALCDVNQAPVDSIIKRHDSEHPGVSLISCSSPYDVAQKASTIITMVPTGKHVQEVYVGEGKSVLSALKAMSQDQRADTLCIDQSTIEQSVSNAVALQMRQVGADLVDAPVSGGVIGAEKGTLAIMVGGSKTSYHRSVPVLQSMARKVTYCGDLGAGLAAKISNNLLLGITMLGLSEAMLLGRRLGVDPQVLADIINNSTGRCWSSEINHPVPGVKAGDSSPPAHRNYEGGFVTKLAHKDLALAVSAAEEANVPLAVGRCVEETYRPLAKSKEFGDRDFSVIYEALDSLGSTVQSSKL